MLKVLKTITNNSLDFLYKSTINCIIEAFIIISPYFVLAYFLPNIFKQLNTTTFYLFTLIVALYLLRILFTLKTEKINTKAGYDGGNIIRKNLIKHLQKLPLGFFSKKTTGELHDRVLNNIQLIEMMISHFYSQSLINITIPLFALIFVAFFDLSIAFILLASFLFALPVLYKLLSNASKGGGTRVKKIDSMTSKFLEYLKGIQVFRAFNLTGEKFTNLEDSIKQMKDFSFHFEIKSFSLSLTFSAILELGFVAIIIVTFLNLTLENLGISIALLIISLEFYKSLHKLATNATLATATFGGAKAIYELYNEKELQVTEPTQELKSFDVEFKNVSFDYEKKNTIKDISFKVPQNSFTAIVGSSGAGKSTLLYLLARFWDIQSGNINIGGINLQNIKPSELMDNISMVFQDVYLFNDTILENIKIGDPDASKEEIIEVCKKANCHKFIQNLPNGYDTIVGERGKTLSGGEKQRISIARALLKDSPIILLDEITASLDTKNDKEIVNTINILKKNKTIIVVSHKLDTITNADQILVMDNGKLVESGNLNELLANQSYFSKLWENYTYNN